MLLELLLFEDAQHDGTILVESMTMRKTVKEARKK
jgi:hypothetical protein